MTDKFENGMSVKDIVRKAIELNPDISRDDVVKLVAKYRNIPIKSATARVSDVSAWVKGDSGKRSMIMKDDMNIVDNNGKYRNIDVESLKIKTALFLLITPSVKNLMRCCHQGSTAELFPKTCLTNPHMSLDRTPDNIKQPA